MNAGKTIANLLAAAGLGSALIFTPCAALADEIVQSTGAVTYVSGGVATESLDRLAAMTRDFNLKLVFATKSGEYLSDVKVTIADASGKTMLETMSEGPWLLARLPRGNYQVIASNSGNAITQRVAVNDGRVKTVDFRWSSE